jgi:hypothetical protein
MYWPVEVFKLMYSFAKIKSFAVHVTLSSTTPIYIFRVAYNKYVLVSVKQLDPTCLQLGLFASVRIFPFPAIPELLSGVWLV